MKPYEKTFFGQWDKWSSRVFLAFAPVLLALFVASVVSGRPAWLWLVDAAMWFGLGLWNWRVRRQNLERERLEREAREATYRALAKFN